MKCSLCGCEFDETKAESSCSNCLLADKCSLARCPNCGFEMPLEPDWIKKISKKLKGLRNG